MLFFFYVLHNLMYAYPGCLFSVRYYCLFVCTPCLTSLCCCFFFV